jgi:hypothetical protein
VVSSGDSQGTMSIYGNVQDFHPPYERQTRVVLFHKRPLLIINVEIKSEIVMKLCGGHSSDNAIVIFNILT